jgi:hypothetical protein
MKLTPGEQNTVRFDVSVYDIVIVAVLQSQNDLPDVVTTDRLAVNEPGSCSLDDLEAKVSTSHELEDHV